MYCDLWPYVLWPLHFQIQKRIVSAETIWGNTVDSDITIKSKDTYSSFSVLICCTDMSICSCLSASASIIWKWGSWYGTSSSSSESLSESVTSSSHVLNQRIHPFFLLWLISALSAFFISSFDLRVSFFHQCSKMQIIPIKKFKIQTCFFQFLWFF